MIRHNIHALNRSSVCQLGLISMSRTPLKPRVERNVCNDLQTLIWTTWEHYCQPQLYNSLQGFHSGYAAGPGLVVYGRSRSVDVIVFSSCHFNTLHEAAQPSPLCWIITMPTHNMILLHFKNAVTGEHTRLHNLILMYSRRNTQRLLSQG